MALNTPFPDFKTTGDDKHDIEEYIEDLTDYCTMQNWFDPSKETEAAKLTKPRKRWHAFGRYYPLRSERSTNTVYGFQQMIWRNLTWLLMP